MIDPVEIDNKELEWGKILQPNLHDKYPSQPIFGDVGIRFERRGFKFEINSRKGCDTFEKKTFWTLSSVASLSITF